MSVGDSRKYSIVFKFDQPEVLEAQQANITARGLGADGFPIPDWNNYLSRLIKSEYWSGITQDHIHESSKDLTAFLFHSRYLEAKITIEQLLEAAVLDMLGWLRQVRLEHTVPTIVEMYPYTDGEFAEHIDKTVEALAILGQLATFQNLTPDSFT